MCRSRAADVPPSCCPRAARMPATRRPCAAHVGGTLVAGGRRICGLWAACGRHVRTCAAPERAARNETIYMCGTNIRKRTALVLLSSAAPSSTPPTPHVLLLLLLLLLLLRLSFPTTLAPVHHIPLRWPAALFVGSDRCHSIGSRSDCAGRG